MWLVGDVMLRSGAQCTNLIANVDVFTALRCRCMNQVSYFNLCYIKTHTRDPGMAYTRLHGDSQVSGIAQMLMKAFYPAPEGLTKGSSSLAGSTYISQTTQSWLVSFPLCISGFYPFCFQTNLKLEYCLLLAFANMDILSSCNWLWLLAWIC